MEPRLTIPTLHTVELIVDRLREQFFKKAVRRILRVFLLGSEAGHNGTETRGPDPEKGA